MERTENELHTSRVGKTNPGSNRIKMGECLSRMLPFGVCSEQGLHLLEHESEMEYRFTTNKYIVKEDVKIKVHGRYKKNTVCILTPKGLRLICNTKSLAPDWIKNMKSEVKKFFVCPQLHEKDKLSLAEVQDALIFFSYSKIPSLLSTTFYQDEASLLLLQYLSHTLSSDHHNTVIEIVAEAASQLLPEKTSENKFVSTCCSMYCDPLLRPLSKLFSSDLYLETTEKYFQSQEKNQASREYFLTFKELNAILKLNGTKFESTNMRDTSIGVYAGTGQTLQVFISSNNGTAYRGYRQKKGAQLTSLCDTYASRSNRRKPVDICKNAIILCRKRIEFARTIIDRDDLRKTKTDKKFGINYQHVFLVLMNQHCMQSVQYLGSMSSAEYEKVHAEDRKYMPQIFSNVVMKESYLVDVAHNCKAYLVADLDIKEIYAAMEESETTDRPVTLIIEQWQREYFDQLQESWKEHRLYNQEATEHGFHYLSIENDPFNDPYSNPVPPEHLLD